MTERHKSEGRVQHRMAWLKKRFLKKFERYHRVGKSAQATGISRSTVYHWLNNDEQFARKFEDIQIGQ